MRINLRGVNRYAAAIITDNILKNGQKNLQLILRENYEEIERVAARYGMNYSAKKGTDGVVVYISRGEIEEVDVTGETCPGPLIIVGEKLSSMKPGMRLKIKSESQDVIDDLAVSAPEMNARVIEKSNTRLILEKIEKTEKKEFTGRDRVLVVQSNGTGNAERAYATFIFSKAALSMGKDVTVFLLMDGVSLARRGAAAKVKHPAFPALNELMEEVIEMGAKVYVCEMSAQFRGLTEDKITEGCKIAGAATFITLLSDPRYAVVNF